MKISIYIFFASLVCIFIVGFGFGYYLTPQYQFDMYSKTKMDLGAPDRWLDLRYINAMIEHHRGAVLIAEQIKKNSERTEMQTLASDILINEPKLIEELYSWKRAWYNDARSVSDPILVRLGNKDETFDLRALNALIAHHDVGVKMTQEARIKSSRTEVLNNADAVELFLINSGNTLKGWRGAWYEKK